MVTDEQYGEATEARFLSLMNTQTSDTPPWFIRVKRSKPVWDDRGIDFFAYVWPNGGGRRIKVPIQVKSGVNGENRYWMAQSEMRRNNIQLFVLRPGLEDDVIRRMVYARLYPIHHYNIRFTEFFTTQIQEPLPRLAIERRMYEWVERALAEHMARIS